MPQLMKKTEYDYRKKEGDGLCYLCKTWSYNAADPAAINVWCSECENKSVYGVKAALDAGLIMLE